MDIEVLEKFRKHLEESDPGCQVILHALRRKSPVLHRNGFVCPAWGKPAIESTIIPPAIVPESPVNQLLLKLRSNPELMVRIELAYLPGISSQPMIYNGKTNPAFLEVAGIPSSKSFCT